MNYPELLLYWIRERYAIFQRKEAGLPAPWSDDPVFQTTYFCNVHRENDRVTRWIRDFYSPYVNHPLFEYNMVLARFLNRPATLEAVGFLTEHNPEQLDHELQDLRDAGRTIWGNAYVITTHGQKMDKLAYLGQVLDAVHDALPSIQSMCRAPKLGHPPTCAGAATALQRIPGIGTFLAGQVVADLKNTINHPLYSAVDRATFVVPGPGSIRGVSWFVAGNPNEYSTISFKHGFQRVRDYVDAYWPEGVPPVDNQDLQNCLCEFDKYCRVKTGTGRSKRKYNATGKYRRR